MKKSLNLTEGNILSSLISFALPIILALFFQALYGGVDLLVVGQFSETSHISGVATGSMLMQTITMIVTGLAMGITVLVGRKIGEKKPDEASKAIGSGICLFTVFAVFLTVTIVLGAETLSSLMHAPKEAFDETVIYTKICGAGSIFIVAYNVLGSIFRGIGDSKTPLITVIIACVFNIVFDLIFVAGFNMGAMGAALATVLAQAVSVIISLVIIKRKTLPFDFSKKYIRFNKKYILRELRLGVPIALQEFLVGISFLIIQIIVNSINLTASAGVGVAEKLCAFIMLVPSAFIQAIATFVAQNLGAKKPNRAKKALIYGILTSVAIGVVVGYLSFFHGDILSSIFTNESTVIEASQSYLKSYAIDCILTPFLFCFIGYYNGYGKTMFVMIQGVIGAFCVRVPFVFIMSKIPDVSLFQIGLATPTSTIIQIILCLTLFVALHKKEKDIKLTTEREIH